MFRATANRPLAKMLRELLLVGLIENPDFRCASFHWISGCSYLIVAVLPLSNVSATLMMITNPRMLCWK